MEKSLDILEKISKECYLNTTFYRYNKSSHSSEKYRKGRVDASNWINEMVYYYVRKDKEVIKDFQEKIEVQKRYINDLKNGEYKKGLSDQLKYIERLIDGKIDSN